MVSGILKYDKITLEKSSLVSLEVRTKLLKNKSRYSVFFLLQFKHWVKCNH